MMETKNAAIKEVNVFEFLLKAKNYVVDEKVKMFGKNADYFKSSVQIDLNDKCVYATFTPTDSWGDDTVKTKVTFPDIEKKYGVKLKY